MLFIVVVVVVKVRAKKYITESNVIIIGHEFTLYSSI